MFNDIFAHEDMFPTLLAAAGNPDIKTKLLKGMPIGNKTCKVHLDGYDITTPSREKRQARAGPSSTSTTTARWWALRYDHWKIVFAEQRATGFDVWQEPFVPLRLPKIFNLRSDPFEIGDHETIGYARWRIEHTFVLVPAQQYVGQFLATFKEYPPSQKPGSFSLDSALEALQRGSSGK